MAAEAVATSVVPGPEKMACALAVPTGSPSKRTRPSLPAFLATQPQGLPHAPSSATSWAGMGWPEGSRATNSTEPRPERVRTIPSTTWPGWLAMNWAKAVRRPSRLRAAIAWS